MVAEEVLRTMQGEWQTSNPEHLKTGKVKYLGMELYESAEGFFA